MAKGGISTTNVLVPNRVLMTFVLTHGRSVASVPSHTWSSIGNKMTSVDTDAAFFMVQMHELSQSDCPSKFKWGLNRRIMPLGVEKTIQPGLGMM